ncbi:MAG: MogA/MoaB family molybdenum cofactor biosynthesis protein [Candidatus Omnitrophica bacterium]|nr:MogA/MoaB family molybdenum cofactor biosynthesis protein [Candidatus Omnitrophota bacterium]
MRVGILTVSDKGSQGQRQDLSGKVIEGLVQKALKADSLEYAIVPDEIDLISAKLIEFIDDKKCALVLTTGGTGLGARDVTPEATQKVIEKLVPGIPEAIRQSTREKTSRAMLSRAICGIRKKSLILNLPGSPKAVEECLSVVLDVIPHALDVLEKGSLECGRDKP